MQKEVAKLKPVQPTLGAHLHTLKQACVACISHFSPGTHQPTSPSSPSAPSSPSSKAPEDAPPLRDELFSSLQMEQYGRILANAHKLSPTRGRDMLLARLAENESIIVETCNLLTAVIRNERQITPAAERWPRPRMN